MKIKMAIAAIVRSGEMLVITFQLPLSYPEIRSPQV